MNNMTLVGNNQGHDFCGRGVDWVNFPQTF